MGVLRRGVPADIDADHGRGEPNGKGSGENATEQADNVDMAVLSADVDTSAKHERREGDSGNPSPEGKCSKDGKDEEDNTRGPVLLVQIVDGSAETQDDVENASDPDKGFGKGTSETHVRNREHKGGAKGTGKENQRVGVERKGGVVVDALARAAGGVATEGDDGDGDIAGKAEEELDVGSKYKLVDEHDDSTVV